MNIPFIVLVVVVVVVIALYNSLVAKKNEVENILGSVDVLLKKRYDLIPNLVEVAKKYMKYEQELLKEIVALRSQALQRKGARDENIAIEEQFSKMLGSLMVAVENYPELKANEHFLHLQHALMEIEEQLSAARRAYNQAVTDYNNALEMIPTNIIASMMHYQKKELYAIESAQRENVHIGKLFGN